MTKNKGIRNIKILIIIIISINLLFGFIIQIVSAQAQTDVNGKVVEYSGNSAYNYQCFDSAGNLLKDAVGNIVNARGPNQDGKFTCTYAGVTYFATPIPPKLQNVQFLVVKIVYAIWAFMAGISFVFLIGVGYDYLIRGGTSDTELTKLRKRISNYIIGFVLVFLSLPILTTVFNVLGVNTKVACFNVAMPGFQFFFSNLCTDPNGSITKNPCVNTTSAEGFACGGSKGEVYACNFTKILNLALVGSKCYTCESDPNNSSYITWHSTPVCNVPPGGGLVIADPCQNISSIISGPSPFKGYGCPSYANSTPIVCPTGEKYICTPVLGGKYTWQ